MVKALLYARVSTADKGQNPEVQLSDLRQFSVARGWVISEEIIDDGYSGGTDQRPGLKRLMEAVRSRKVDAVVVAKLDRLFRSLKHIIAVLDEFEALGVHFIALKDQIDLTTPAGRLMVHLLASFAEFEKSLIRERTMAGLAFARKKGKRLGRPVIHSQNEIIEFRKQGLSYRAIAKHLGVPMGTITTAIKAAQKSPQTPTPESPKKSGGQDV